MRQGVSMGKLLFMREDNNMMKRWLALALVCGLLFACGCGRPEKPEAIAEPIGTAAFEPATAAVAPPEKQAKVTITKIDMAAPESRKYREWLEAYHTQLYEPKNNASLPEPSTREEGGGTWRTWDWNDTWALEQYENPHDEGMKTLRARDKATGEIRIINEQMSYNYDGGHIQIVVDSIVDETHLLYSVACSFSSQSVYLYTLGQGSELIMTKYVDSYEPLTFADETRTQLYWRENDLRGANALFYADLRKMVAGESGAVRKITQGNHFEMKRLSPSGRYLPIDSYEADGRRFIIFDLVTGDELYSWRLDEQPKNLFDLGWIDGHTLYCYFSDDHFYEIRCDFPE